MWYIVLSRSLPGTEENKQTHYEEHRQWLEEQHKAGRMLFSVIGAQEPRSYR
jgi:uncharacterized protein YciI